MKRSTISSLCWLLTLLLVSCGPTYPKERLTESLVELCRKEYGIEVQAEMAQTTIGVLIAIPGLMEELIKQASSSPQEPPPPILIEGKFNEDQFTFRFLSRGAFYRVDPEKLQQKQEARRSRPKEEERSEPLKKLDHVSTALRRVALSTDAFLEFYTLIARDPAASSTEIVFSGHLDDLKRVQYLDISIGELSRRSRVFLRPQAEVVGQQVGTLFLKDLSQRSLPQLLSRYSSASRKVGELFPKILELAVLLQGKEETLISSSEQWSIRQVGAREVWVYVPLAPAGEAGALLFVVDIAEGQGSFLTIERLAAPMLPQEYQRFGPPEKWGGTFYLEPIRLPEFLSEQVARRVLGEFHLLDETAETGSSAQAASTGEISRAVVESCAYVLNSYRYQSFDRISVIDALTGTEWAVSAKELPAYRRKGAAELNALLP